MNKLIGIAFVVLVAVAAIFAFSARRGQPLPATQLHIEKMLTLDAERAGQRIVAVGEAGRIFLSDDGGKAWTEAKSPTPALLTGLSFFDAQHGWAVGHDAVILQSQDGGASWREVYKAPDEQKPLFDVLFVDPEKGFAVGAYATYLETVDGGKTWQRRAILEEDKHFNAITRLDDGTLIIVGEAGTLLRSVDGGVSWKAVASPYHGSYFGVLALKDGVVVAFGMRGKVARSLDRGATWALVETGLNSSLFGGRMLPDGRVVLVGQDGVLLASRDQGATFIALDKTESRARSALIADEDGSWLLFGEAGVERIKPSAP
jgi:photosystem II stability/assembly factor-like uncharacterized protein